VRIGGGPVLTLPAPETPEVSIVIVTARDADRLLRCLRAVVAGAAGAPPYEVVIVLNAAEPGMGGQLAETVTGARVVRSDAPLGLAGGANLGIQRARGRLLHLLHDDTEVVPGWLTALAGALGRHPEAGAAGGLVLDLDGGKAQSAGHVLWRDGTTAPRWVGPPPALDGFAGPYPVDYCGTASLLLRREAWAAVGGFDEGFHPAYYVDVDFAMALRSRGYTVICEPASRVRHERGGTTGIALRTFVAERNRERLRRKWAADLVHQAPAGSTASALQRALRVTERRAKTVAATGPPPVTEPVAPAGDDHRLAGLEREVALFARDAAVKDAFIAHAERLLADTSAAYTALADHHADVKVELGELRAQAATLDAIVAGGWWRLRARLLPWLALALRVRGGLRRRA
jgi:GT2 family glycosyltransferase